MLEIFESWEDFVRVSKNFHLIEVCEVWKLFKVRKFKLLTPFQNTKAFFHQTSNFFFHRTSWDQLYHHGLWKLIFNRISWNTSQNWMGLVSSWSRIKIISYEVKFIFLLFGRIFIAYTWFWLLNPFWKVWEVWKIFQIWKINFSHHFQKQKDFFHQTSNFFFHRTPWDKLFHRG